MIIAGIDYSYTSPAICVYDTDKEFKFENLVFHNYYVPTTKKVKTQGWYGNIHVYAGVQWTSDEERYQHIAQWATDVLKHHKVQEVQIEGYSMGSTGGLVFNIAENTSLLKQWMRANGVKFEKPSPGSVKKNFTGKGNAKKPEMVARFKELFNVDLHTILGINEMGKPIDDLVDSCANLMTHKLLLGD